MPAPGPPLRVPHGGLGASAKMNHAPGKDGGGSLRSAELRAQGGGSGGPTKCCLHGRSVGCPGRGHVPFREDACVGVRLGESCSGRAFPPGSPHTALLTRLASCGRRQSCHRAVALGTSSPGGHRAVRLSVPGHCAVPVAGAHAHTHSAAFESHQGALKLGVIFINLPRFSFSEIWCCLAWMNMGKPALVDTRALWDYVSLSSPPGAGRIAGEGKGWLGDIHSPGGTSRNIPKAHTVPEDRRGERSSPLLQHKVDAECSLLRKMEQDAEGRMASNSQFPSLKADKFKTANVPRKMRPSEIYSSPRLTAPIRCACQPGSLLKNQDKAAARPHCPPNGWQREERKEREVFFSHHRSC